MNKEEIIARIKSLTRKVKSPGRTYSKVQREEMRNEISVLKIELDKIKFEEDILLINEFQEKHPLHLIPERETLKNEIDEIANNTTDPKLMLVLKYRLTSFNSELNYLSSYQKEIGEITDALAHLNKNEKIPDTNPNRNKGKEEIQKLLAIKFRVVSTGINKLNSTLKEIQRIVTFFHNDDKLTGFVYLSNAIFTEASNFDKGYAIVEQGSKKFYFTSNGNAYKIENNETDIPKTQKTRVNPELIPFEIKDGNFNYLKGYKNTNGEIAIPVKYTLALPFVNGFAKVRTEIKNMGDTFVKHGLIDETGRMVLHFDNPFFEIEEVYNDIVKYKRHLYGPDSYERISSFSFNVMQKSNYLGLYSGYLIFGEVKPSLFNEIDKILEIEKGLPDLKTNGEVDSAHLKIKDLRDNIDFYLKYVTESI